MIQKAIILEVKLIINNKIVVIEIDKSLTPMGTNSSSLSQSTLNSSSILKRFQIIDKNEEKNFTIVKEK